MDVQLGLFVSQTPPPINTQVDEEEEEEEEGHNVVNYYRMAHLSSKKTDDRHGYSYV